MLIRVVTHLSRPISDLIESIAGSIHHLKVQSSEFDITTVEGYFQVQDT